MIAEIDEDQDGQISFREFLLIFRKAAKVHQHGMHTFNSQSAGRAEGGGLVEHCRDMQRG